MRPLSEKKKKTLTECPRAEITQENETVRTVEMSDLEPNVAIADQTFFFRMPSGVDVFQG